MDSHRNFSPDEHDRQGNQPERGYSDPEWDRPDGEPRYAAPAPAPGGVTYGSPVRAAPVQQYGDNPAYRDFPVSGEPRGGYPFDGQSPYQGLGDTGGAPPADGASAVLAMPIGSRSGDRLPPLPPAFVAEPPAPAFPPGPAVQTSAPPAFMPEPPAAPGAVHTAPTSGLPYLGADGTTGRPPLAGDARPGSGRSGWGGGDQAEETQVVRHATEAIDRSALRRSAGGPGGLGDGVYRSRHPGMAVAIVVVTVLFEVMALRLLASAFLTSRVQVGGSIASSFLVLGMPMFGFGLYGLLSGAAAAPGAGLRVWLRPPLVYLPVALVLLVTAGLAAA